MAKREVELIIKARDQATAAAKGIVDILNDLAKAQTGLTKAGVPANSALARLSDEISKLQKNAQGLTALNRLSQNLDRTTANIEKMESALGDTEAKLRETQSAVSVSASRFLELESAARQAGFALEREQGGLAASRAEQQRLNAAVKEARENFFALKKAIDPTSAAFDGQNAAASRAAITLQTLIDKQKAQERAVAQQRSAVRIAEQAYKSLADQTSKAGIELAKIEKVFERSVIAAREDAEALNEAKAALGEMKGAAGTAAAALGGVELRQESIAAESKRTAEAIQKVSDALVRQAAARSAAASEGNNANAAENELRRQRDAVAAARQTFQQAKADLESLARAFRATAEPTAIMSAELAAARLNTIAASQELRNAEAALSRLAAKTLATANAQKQKARLDRESREASFLAAVALQHQVVAEERAALVARILGREVGQLTSTLRGVGSASAQAGKGLLSFGDQSRRALSLIQRLRGEALSLATQFVGLYAAISATSGVIDAIRAVEAAGSRLNAVFGGDASRTREELRFLSQEADRLGLSFRVLSQEFGRFAIATDAAGFSMDATRKIFISVAESARVNKVSVEELEGTFLALQQMVSKGTVSMEELRRQLGDRLPGAFNIFADALGVTTAELSKMLAAGEVVASQDTLLKFADELDKRFGGALPKALETVTTQLDKFQNNLFEAQARIGSGGFADALRDALLELNEFFRSREGRDFFLGIGAAMGRLVDILVVVGKNFEPILLVIQSLIALNAALYFRNLAIGMQTAATVAGITTKEFLAADVAGQKMVITAASGENAFKAFTFALGATITQLRAVAVAFVTTGATSQTTRTALTALSATFVSLRIAIVGMVASLGVIGVISLAIGGLISLFTGMATAVPDATRAVDEHTRQLDAYTKEAGEAERAGRAFNKALVDTTALEALGNLQQLEEGFKALRKTATEAAQGLIIDFVAANRKLTEAERETVDVIRAQTESLRAGRITVLEFQDSMVKLAETVDGPNKGAFIRLVAQLRATADSLRLAEIDVVTQTAVTENLGISLGKTTEFYKKAGIAIDEVTKKIRLLVDARKEELRIAENRQAAEDKVVGFIPDRARAADQASRQSSLDQAAREALAGLKEGTADFKRVKALIDEANAELREAFKKENEKATREPRERRDAQAEFNAELKRTNDLRDFEATLVNKSTKEQQVELAVFQARQKAAQDKVKFSAEQETAIRASVANQFEENEALRIKNAVLDQQIALQRTLGQEVSTQLLLEQEARQQNIDLLAIENAEWVALTTAIIEREKAEARLQRLTEEVRALEQIRLDKLREFQAAEEAGNFKSAEARQQQLEELEALRIKIVEMRDAAIAMAIAIGDPKLVAALEKINADLSFGEKNVRELAEQMEQAFAQGATQGILDAGDAIGAAIDGTTSWGEALENVRDIFLKFAADFLRQIAQMIIQKAILNAIGGGFDGIAGAVAHKGGIIGRQSLPKRTVNPMLFHNAARYHTGGVAGLKRNEVPAILQRGEEVVTTRDPRHAMNGGAGGSPVTLKNINLFDSASVVSEALSTEAGERAFLNVVRRRGPTIRRELGVG